MSGNIDDGSTGNVACDSFHKYKEDVQLISNMAMTDYRFSISWSRVLLPNGKWLDVHSRTFTHVI